MPLRSGGAIKSVSSRNKQKSHIISAKDVAADGVQFNLELGTDLFIVSLYVSCLGMEQW